MSGPVPAPRNAASPHVETQTPEDVPVNSPQHANAPTSSWKDVIRNATNEAALATMPITPAARSTKSRLYRSAAHPAAGAASTWDSAIAASANPTSKFES